MSKNMFAAVLLGVFVCSILAGTVSVEATDDQEVLYLLGSRASEVAMKDLPFDLIMTGAQASDDGYAEVGPILAEFLGVPHATMVKKVELNDNVATVTRELEGGLEEVVELKLPALLTIQTGINEPRYVSISGLRKAMKKKIKVLNLADIGLSENEVGEAGSWIRIEEMYVPPVEKQVEFLKGSPEEIAAKIVEIIKDKGLI